MMIYVGQDNNILGQEESYTNRLNIYIYVFIYV